MAFDDNLRRIISSSNLFGGASPQTQPPVTTPVNTPTTANPMLGIEDIVKSLYTPETTYSDRYLSTLNAMPQRPNPRLRDRVLSSLYGISGDREAAEDALYPGYRRNLGDWKMQMDALSPGMLYERTSNANERMNAYQTGSQILRERDIARKEESDRKLAESRDYANQIRAQIAQGGTLSTDERTGQTFMVYRDGRKVPVDISKIPPLELEGIRSSNRLTEIDARGDIQKEIAAMQAASREEIAALSRANQEELTKLRYELAGQNRWSTPIQAFDKEGKPLDYMISINGVTGESKKVPLGEGVVTRTIPPGSGSGSTQSETQKAAGIQNKARQVRIANPEWAKYIKFDNSNRFVEVTRPSSIFGVATGPDQATYKKIYEAIYGSPLTATPINGPVSQEEKPPGNVPGSSDTTALKAKATKFLQDNNLPVTDRNIEHAIKTGRVK